jgi:hypothetical protein
VKDLACEREKPLFRWPDPSASPQDDGAHRARIFPNPYETARPDREFPVRKRDGGAHLITVEPDPFPYSSSFIHSEKWHDFNWLQTCRSVELIHPMVTHDQALKPALMAQRIFRSFGCPPEGEYAGSRGRSPGGLYVRLYRRPLARRESTAYNSGVPDGLFQGRSRRRDAGSFTRECIRSAERI